MPKNNDETFKELPANPSPFSSSLTPSSFTEASTTCVPSSSYIPPSPSSCSSFSSSRHSDTKRLREPQENEKGSNKSKKAKALEKEAKKNAASAAFMAAFLDKAKR